MRVLSLRLFSRLLLASLPFALLAVSVQAEDAYSSASAVPSVSAAQSGVVTPHVRNKDAKYDIDRIGHRNIGSGLNLYSIEREEQLGQQLATTVDLTSKLVNDPVITEYVNRIGQIIVRHSDAQVPFTIKVIESDEINAFALPGGFFYVNTGLILAADNEAELAGLMAHEIAHVAARHATRAETRQQIWNALSVPLLYLGGPAGMALRSLAGVAGPMSFLKYTRDAEREADLLGVEYEYATGYDPQAFVQFFEKLQSRKKHSRKLVAKAFATHPMTDDRIRRAQKEIAIMLPTRSDYILDTSEFEEVKARLGSSLVSYHITHDGKPKLHRHTNDEPDSGAKSDDEQEPVLHRHPSG